MNGLQKVIKYCAMAFAVFLAVVIFGSILTAVAGVATGIAGVNALTDEKERINLSEQYTGQEIDALGIYNITVDCNAEITVQRGDVLSIEAFDVTEDYEIRCTNGKLSIVEDRPNFYFDFKWLFWFLGKDATIRERVVITVPETFVAEHVMINSGSGIVSLAEVNAEQLVIDSDSGKVTARDINVSTLNVDSGSGKVSLEQVNAEKTIMNTGSGSVTAEDSVLGALLLDSGSGAVNLKNVVVRDVVLDSGSGSVAIEGDITGECAFDTGSGSISVAVNGAEADYRVVADCGSGPFRINGKKLKDGSYGKNVKGELVFDSGSGAVNVTFDTPEEE